MRSTIDHAGRVTIPKPIREALGVFPAQGRLTDADVKRLRGA